MSTWVDDLKKIECFLMEWSAELCCQIKENQQRRDESTHSNVDQRVETRNLASQSHSVINSNLEDFRSLTLADLGVSPSTGPKPIHLESNLGGKSDNVIPSMQEVSERCSSGADATEESRRASYYSKNPESRSLTMEDDDQRQIEELRMSNRERFANLLEISQDLPPRSSSSKASMEIPAEMVESNNKLTKNLPQEPHTNNSFLEENSEKLKVTLNLVEVKAADVTIEEMWESRALVGYLSFRNLDLHLLDADNNADTRQIQSMMMKQHLGTAHKVFVKMLRKQMAGIHDFVELSIVLGVSYGSMDCCSSFVFDPGKRTEFSLHIEGVETLVILLFDPGGDLIFLDVLLSVVIYLLD